jgi:predicted metal-dependent phosphotriesterase family hydrolase
MKDYLQRLAEAGFKDSEIETMAVKTPMALLGD